MTEHTHESPVGLERRNLISGAGIAATAAMFALSRSARASGSLPPSNCHTIIVYLRGGADGLSIVHTPNDPFYTNARPDLGLPAAPTDGVRQLDTNFSLSGAAQQLFIPYRDHDLAFVHACGSPEYQTLSHFVAQDYSETGVQIGSPGFGDGKGWWGRYNSESSDGLRILEGHAHGNILPLSMRGGPATLPIPNVEEFQLNGTPESLDLRNGVLRCVYEEADDPAMSAGLNSLDTVDALSGLPWNSSAYGSHPFGIQLARASVMLRNMSAPPRGIAIDFPGSWDDHTELGPNLADKVADPTADTMYKRVEDLSQALRAFRDEMKAEAPNVDYTLFVMTEFGRRVQQNGALGTDHGRGGLMMVMGNRDINGKKVYTRTPVIPPSGSNPGAPSMPGWSGLELQCEVQSGSDPQNPTHNLIPTTHWWDVLGEHLNKRCGVPTSMLSDVFDYTVKPLGVFAG